MLVKPIEPIKEKVSFGILPVNVGQRFADLKSCVVTLPDNLNFKLHGVDFNLKNTLENFKAGDQVIIILNSFFYCYLAHEYENWQAKLKSYHNSLRQAEIEAKNKRLNNLAERAYYFHCSILLPFDWTVAYKDNLSGLAAGSWGDGRKKNTVEHVLLKQDYSNGQLKRNSNDFLCTAASGSNGKRWSGICESRSQDAAGRSYLNPVTCSKCLQLISRLNLKTANKQ